VAIWNGISAGNDGQRQVNYLTDRMNPMGTVDLWAPSRSNAQQFQTEAEAEAARAAIKIDHVREDAKVYPNLEVNVLTGRVPGWELT
jgi:hypothetical protein